MHFHYQHRRMFYSSLPTEDIAKLLDFSQFNMWEPGSQGSYNLQFLIMSKAEHLFIFLRACIFLFSLSCLYILSIFLECWGFSLFLDLNIFIMLPFIYSISCICDAGGVGFLLFGLFFCFSLHFYLDKSIDLYIFHYFVHKSSHSLDSFLHSRFVAKFTSVFF